MLENEGVDFFVKRTISLLLTACLLLTCLAVTVPEAQASTKASVSRTIAIVFDNSGSMYYAGNPAWCRATYAMEVFAAMLNAGDTLMIYPMHPIEAGGNVYDMNKPLKVTDASKAEIVRDIKSVDPGTTPIESIDAAAAGLKAANGDQKYLIVLTDGATFYQNDRELYGNDTVKALDERISKYAGKDMSVMYLGIGADAAMPNTGESEYFIKRKATRSEAVLSTLTEMCNRIFGRDILPADRLNGKEVDVSMKKLVVFVQGNNISDVKLTNGSGQPVGKLTGSQEVKYSTRGCGGNTYTGKPDESLQGTIATYTDCPAGTYKLSYSGTATSVEVYYEPDVELNFVFTDLDGNEVAPELLYEDEYMVSYGMKDGQTGEMVTSPLLGKTIYRGSYSVNGAETPISGESGGSVKIPLKENDKFDATLTVTYLSGYTITKNATDFGWPADGITVKPNENGDLKLKISGGQESYSLRDLESGKPYTVKVYYEDQQLTGADLEAVELKWEPEKSNAEIQKEFADDHYKLYIRHKNPASPQSTPSGKCTVDIHGYYTAEHSNESHAQKALTYTIDEDNAALQMTMVAPEDYIVISDLGESKPVEVDLLLDGRALTDQELSALRLDVDCEMEYEVTPKESGFYIQLLPTDIDEGDYIVKATAYYVDAIGRECRAEDSTNITLSAMPLWLKWVISILLLLLIFLIIWKILHIRVLPKKLNTRKNDCSMNFDGEDVKQSTSFAASLKKDQLKVECKYGGRKFGITSKVKPGRESYLYKASAKRSAEVQPLTVKKFGPAKIMDATMGSTKFVLDEDTNKFGPAIATTKPFLMTHGNAIRFSGTINDAGVDKDFDASIKLNFKKK